MSRVYITTAIPYVNAPPHIGHALEFVQADILARERRQRGDEVRFLSGTDDNALKNVLAAEAAGVPVADYVAERADDFEKLAGELDLSHDDYIRTSTDLRHQPGVERLWRATAEVGDLYTKEYEGLYCVGCEQYYKESELTGGRCPEHGTEPDVLAERNWFFRLSRYGDRLLEAIESGRLRIEPEGRRNEVVSFIESGLEDISVSRSAERAHGWGIPVPDDPSQVIYVWYDALGNYITALGYGTSDDDFQRWWAESDERIHVIGKGILRFHAVYWPAFLLSAGEPLPTAIFVHDYLTANGRKISKSLGNTVDPGELIDRYGADALRWWFAADVPRVGDADFTEERLVARANEDLANGFGNLVNRVATLVERYGPVDAAGVPDPGLGVKRKQVQAALDRFDIRGSALEVADLIRSANAYIQQQRPWELAKSGEQGQFEQVIATLLRSLGETAELLTAFVPDVAQLAIDRLEGRSQRVVFTRISGAAGDQSPTLR